MDRDQNALVTFLTAVDPTKEKESSIFLLLFLSFLSLLFVFMCNGL